MQTEPPVCHKQISVPNLVGRTPRAKARTIRELLAVAEECGLGDLVSRVVQAAPAYGFKVDTGRWTIALKRIVTGHKRPQTVIGVYLDSSSPAGLMIGCWCEVLGIDAAEMPGTPTARAPGG